MKPEFSRKGSGDFRSPSSEVACAPWADVLGVSAVECGNYRDHSLHSAREWCKLVLEQGISVDAFDRSVLA